jgi:hypothetical protein
MVQGVVFRVMRFPLVRVLPFAFFISLYPILIVPWMAGVMFGWPESYAMVATPVILVGAFVVFHRMSRPNLMMLTDSGIRIGEDRYDAEDVVISGRRGVDELSGVRGIGSLVSSRLVIEVVGRAYLVEPGAGGWLPGQYEEVVERLLEVGARMKSERS